MERFKISEHYYVDEFVYPQIHRYLGEFSRSYVSEAIVSAVEFIRQLSGKSTWVNNWGEGGDYKQSGLRSHSYKNSAKYSLHKFGQAVDIKVAGMTSHQMHELVMEHETLFYTAGITRIEHPDHTKVKVHDWLHLDTGYHEEELKIKTFIP